MSPLEALADVRGYAAANRIRFTDHAHGRMMERGAVPADVRCALMGATACRAQPSARWRVEGLDRDGDAMTVVVALEDGVLVVTMF